MSYMDREKRPWIHLVDGGIADNLGCGLLHDKFIEGTRGEAFNPRGIFGARFVLIVRQSSHQTRCWTS